MVVENRFYLKGGTHIIHSDKKKKQEALLCQIHRYRKEALLRLVKDMKMSELDDLDGITSISLIVEGDSVLGGGPCKLRKEVQLFHEDKYL